MIEVGKEARRPVKTVLLSRYACFGDLVNHSRLRFMSV
jgi:hypothetical protein